MSRALLSSFKENVLGPALKGKPPKETVTPEETANVITTLIDKCGKKVRSAVLQTLEPDEIPTRCDSGSYAPTTSMSTSSTASSQLTVDIIENLVAAAKKGTGTNTAEMSFIRKLILTVASGSFDGGKILRAPLIADLFGVHKNSIYNVRRQFSMSNVNNQELQQGMEAHLSRKRHRDVSFRTWDENNIKLARLARGRDRAPNSNQLTEEVKKIVIDFWTDGRFTIESPCKKYQVEVIIDGVKSRVSAHVRYPA